MNARGSAPFVNSKTAISGQGREAEGGERAVHWFTERADAAAERLDVDLETGLSDEEARSRLEKHGRNEIVREEPPGPARILASQFTEPLVVVLIGAAIVATAIWLLEEPRSPAPYDAVVILAIVVLNAVLGFVQEYRAERAVEALKELTAPEARVRRGGDERKVDAGEIVPGDVLVLEAGDRVAADARLVQVTSLKTEEAPLTGESVSVSKQTEPIEDRDTAVGDRTNMVFMGTSVTYGRGFAVVTATGMSTEMGGIATLVQEAGEERTPLQRQLARVGRQLGVVVLGIAAVVGVAAVLQEGTFTAAALLRTFLFAVALAVAAVPEGLPAVVTASLAMGVRRLARRNAIVRRLPAVETLGSADVICSDKTGTVTRNEMTVRKILLGEDREVEVAGEGFEPKGQFRQTGQGDAIDAEKDESLMRLLRMAALNNDAVVSQAQGGRWEVDGDPTEGALVVASMKAGIDAGALREDVPREGEIPFSGERKRMTTIHPLEGVRTAIVKGGPELILERCARIRKDGETKELDEEMRAAILKRVDAFAEDALRNLAIASRALPDDVSLEDENAVERDLVLEGIVGMIDPPREETAGAVHEAAAAGIRSILLTGDHVLTARAIARLAGFADADDEALSGREISAMSDDEFGRRVREVNVYGRLGPEEKMRILRTLREQGRTVAMTGDGVNDAPAVKQADIGIAMGITGTDVTKDASELILTDDNFATIVTAVSEGRRVFDNIRAFVRYLLSANAGEVLTIFAAVMLAGVLGFAPEGGLFLPLLPTQILWINLVTDGPPALALGVGPADPEHMRRPPRPGDESVINRPMGVLIATVGVVIMLGNLFVLDAYLPGGFVHFMGLETHGEDAVRYARTAVFTTILMFEMFDVFNCLSQTRSAFRSRVHRHPWLLGAVALSLSLHAAVIYWPPLQRAFDTVPLKPQDWLLAASTAASVVLAVEILKRTPLVRPRR